MEIQLFRFLDEEEFAALDHKARISYLVRAHQELTERQRVLRDQMRRTVAVVDIEATIPAPQSLEVKNKTS